MVPSSRSEDETSLANAWFGEFLDYTMLEALRLIYRQAHVLFLKALSFFDSLIRLDFQKPLKLMLTSIKSTKALAEWSVRLRGQRLLGVLICASGLNENRALK